MADNDRWYEDRDERSARDDTAWRASDRYPPNDPDMEARRGSARDDEARRTYGAGDYENQYARPDDQLRYGGPAYADEPRRGDWPPYEPGRDSMAARDRGGVDWRGEHGHGEHGRGEHGRHGRGGDWRGHPDQHESQREPMWARHEDRRANSGGPEERNPWFGREPGEQDRDRGPGEGRSFWERTRDEMATFFGGAGGEHRGKGPRGYRRSDERIREDINDRLTDDAWLDASDIEVRVQGGEATLDGRVRTREDKRRAEDLAERVSGVSHVQNNLRVTEPREPGRHGMRQNQAY